MYRARVEAVSGLQVKAGGKWLTCIGNRVVRAGDMVWTDGRCVYGHDREPQTPIVIANPPKDLAIPLVFFDKTPTSVSQNVSAAGYTFFSKAKVKPNYQDTTELNIYSDLLMANNRGECRFSAVMQSSNLSTFAVNLNRQYDFYELQKFCSGETLTVSVIKNGHTLRELDCSQNIKDLKSDVLKYAREHAGGTVTIPKEHWVISYDPTSLHLFNADDVEDVPADAEGYLVAFPLPVELTWEYYGVEAGKAYFDASVEGVIIRKGKGWIGSLYPGSPKNRPWYDVRTAQSSSWLSDLGAPWGVIEDENNWAFIFSAFVGAQASGYYVFNGSAISKGANVNARRTWLYTPTGSKELCYSLTGYVYDNNEHTPIQIQQSYPSGALPIQDRYSFTINSTNVYLSNGSCQNAATMNISVYDDDGDILWTGNLPIGTYLTMCKHKGILLGIDDRGGFGLFDRQFNQYSRNYGAVSGDVPSGLYRIQEKELELMVGGYLKNQKLCPMKRYKNWWNQIQSDTGGD